MKQLYVVAGTIKGYYQFTFFFALGLLAIVVTVYVFSVTQIGRATDLESKRQKDIISAQKETSEKQIKQIQGQLDEAKRSGRLDDKAFVDELNKGHREIRSYTVQLNRLKARTNLIKRFGAVALPGSAIIATIVLTTIANAVSGNHTAYSLTLWLIGLFTLLFAIFRFFKTLGAIEDVTINSQEAIEKLPEAVKSALIAVELQKKPALVFAFKGGQFPYTAQVGQIINVDCVLSLSSGDSARNIFMFFNAPPGFIFPIPPGGLPNTSPTFPPDDLPNYTAIFIKPPDLPAGVSIPVRITLNTPTISGNYILFYQFLCEGFNSGRMSLQIVVNNSTNSLANVGFTPASGATDVNVTPTFIWNIIKGSSSYDFVLAQDIGQTDKFALINYSITTPINSVVSPQTLKYNTTYYWRVRANLGSEKSPWLTLFFPLGLCLKHPFDYHCLPVIEKLKCIN